MHSRVGLDAFKSWVGCILELSWVHSRVVLDAF